MNRNMLAHSFARALCIFTIFGLAPSVRLTTAQRQPALAMTAKSQEGTVEFSDDFSTDPNTNGLWTIHRNLGDLEHEAVWHPLQEVFYLTRAPIVGAGVAMFANYELTATEWTARFKYKVGGGSGADGFVFMFYKDKAAYNDGPPVGGGGLGFAIHGEDFEIIPVAGYGIEFDGYYNPEWNDPSGNHIAVLQDEFSNHLKSHNDSRTEDNTWHLVRVHFDHGHLHLTLDGEPRLFYQFRNPNYTHSGVGFGAATGGLDNNHIIEDFVVSVPEAADGP